MQQVLSRYHLLIVLTLSILFGLKIPIAAETIYIDQNATASNNGFSWTDAYTDLQDALTASNLSNGDTILIAEGIYYTTEGSDRTLSFVVNKAIHIFGGFSPQKGVTAFDFRDEKKYPTILSGDIDRNGFLDIRNSYNVMEVYADAIIEGLIFEHGHAETKTSDQTGRGGALFLENSSAKVRNCTFRNNYAYIGGGIYFRNGKLHIENCLLFHNRASKYGSAICPSFRTISQLVGCTIVENYSNNLEEVSAIYAYKTKIKVDNCIFWGNEQNALGNKEGRIAVSNCSFQANKLPIWVEDLGRNKMNSNSDFVNIFTRDYRLKDHKSEINETPLSKSKVSQKFTLENGLPEGQIMGLFYSEGRLWYAVLTTDDIVYKEKRKFLIIGHFNGNNFENYSFQLDEDQSSLVSLHEFIPIKHQKILIRFSDNKIILFDRLTQKFTIPKSTELDYDDNYVENLKVQKLSLKKLSIPGSHHQLSGEKFVTFDDSGRNFWVGTNNNITEYRIESDIIRSLGHPFSFRGITPLNDTVILASSYSNGFMPIHRNTNHLLTQPSWLKNFSSDKIASLTLHYNSDEGALWLDAKYAIKKQTPAGLDNETFPLDKSLGYVGASIVVGDSMIVGSYGWLQIFDLSKRLWRKAIPIKRGKINFLSHHSNSIFVSTRLGLQMVNLKTHAHEMVDSTNLFLSAWVEADSMWCGTETGLLFKYDLSTTPIKKIEEYDLTNYIFSVTRDGIGRLWLGTSDGICYQIDQNSENFVYLPKDQISHHEANRYSIFFDHLYNSMYVGTTNGLNIIQLDNLRSDSIHFKIFSDSYSYFEGDKLASIDYAQNLEEEIYLPAKNRYFEIRYYCDAAIGSELENYEYRLNQGKWINHGRTNSFSLTDLRSGYHELEVRARHMNGRISSNSLKYQIQVDNFFYTKWWFFSAIGLVLATVIYLWFLQISGENERLEKEVDARTTELKNDKEIIEKQAKKLRSLDQLKNRFFANISHELRTPLTLIKGPLQQTKKVVVQNDKITSKINTALSNVETLQRRIDELLDLSKLENGSLQLTLKPTDLIQFINVSVSNFHSMLIAKNIEYTFKNELADHWVTSLDKSKFEKIIFNLIHNAIKFTPIGGHINLNLKKENDFIRIDVEDNGKGISSGDIAFIFDRYFQSNDTAIPPEGGTGIGLSLVQELTDLMGGTIRVKSEENIGTSFSLKFPFKRIDSYENFPLSSAVVTQRDSKGLKEKSADVPSSPPTPNAKRILIVEDHRDLRAHIISLLENLYEIEEAENGVIAWEKLQTSNYLPDLIISDVMMPELDGFGLLQKVKEVHTLKKIPFCFLTARAGVQDRILAFRMGIDDYLVKPFDEEELLARVENLLSNAACRMSIKEDLSYEEDELLKENEDQFIEEFKQLTIDQLTNPKFSIDFLAKRMNMPTRSFYRFIQRETGLTPNNFVKEIRLNEARTILEKGQFASIAEVGTQVGFYDPKYFSRLFKKRFGKLPSDYL